MTTAKQLPGWASPTWERLLKIRGLLYMGSFSPSEQEMRDDLDRALRKVSPGKPLNTAAVHRISNEVLKILLRYSDDRPICLPAYEAVYTKDGKLIPVAEAATAAPSKYTHQQKVMMIRLHIFVVVLIALYGIISDHEDQADKISLYTGGGAVPIAWWCAQVVAKQYDKRYGDNAED
ncbi:hypothetical protein AB0F17_42925 [Nonomuraea sp. NPDC026600]|uniref:hypothetical protein n=1 Tax=Nonomuraea sp. NPDC026600 TaxID=3155363 RepID=UPI0033FB0BA0